MPNGLYSEWLLEVFFDNEHMIAHIGMGILALPFCFIILDFILQRFSKSYK
eukprot:Awhi_evm1s7633